VADCGLKTVGFTANVVVFVGSGLGVFWQAERMVRKPIVAAREFLCIKVGGLKIVEDLF
jgi:hypothetical protein